MRFLWLFAAVCAAAPLPEPKMASLHPFAGRGAFTVTVRGNGLSDANAVFLEGAAPFSAAIEKTEAEPPGENTGRNRTPFDLVRVRIDARADAKPGRYLFRLVTPRGASNALPVYITELAVEPEPPGSHETPESAIAITQVPAVHTGRIARRGETDYFAFEAKAGETLSFEAISGLPSTAAAGSNANGFDPSLSIFEAAGSWFDPKRLKRIAFHDEALWVIGRGTDPLLAHRFEKSGRYLLRLEAYSGQGGPDYSYQLKVSRGERAPAAAALGGGGGRGGGGFARRLSADRLNELAARGAMPKDRKSIETYRGGEFKLPATLEGAILEPGAAYRARFHLDGPQDIAIEVETPGDQPPLFNPVVRLLDGAGEEVAANVFANRGACTGAMTKSIAAKTVVPLKEAGDYTIEVRETASDLAGPGFQFRVQVRPQVPHVGTVRIDEDHINLPAGDAKTVRVSFDREEDYRGAVAVTAEGLPPGVVALAGADFEPDKDPPLTSSKRERYTPRAGRLVVVFSAAADAPAMPLPVVARLLVRPLLNGKPGAVLMTKQIPLMVVKKP